MNIVIVGIQWRIQEFPRRRGKKFRNLKAIEIMNFHSENIGSMS